MFIGSEQIQSGCIMDACVGNVCPNGVMKSGVCDGALEHTKIRQLSLGECQLHKTDRLVRISIVRSS